MALFDFLKKKESAERAKKSVKKPVKASVEKPDKSARAHFDGPATIPPKAELGGKPVKTGKRQVFSYEAIKQPHISEKASYLAEKDQYIFEILPNCNKKQIKDAVEGLYKVDVLSVNMIKIPAKKRRLGRTEGWRKSYKKAIVKIKNGQKIEIL